MVEDLRVCLHHICHLVHNGYRGSVEMYESHPGQEFTVSCDLPQTADIPTFLPLIRQRLLNTNPSAVAEQRHYEPLMIYDKGPDQAPTQKHRIFLRVSQK